MYTTIETERGDEYTEKEAEKERGDEIKSLGRTVNREGMEWGVGREKICHHHPFFFALPLSNTQTQIMR
ncbi:hypothetical protein CFP56_025488 [Quercus suber]|uniref:Uncharacterized protein n=1 Tax=Quercus suber TaxID=58331 RepID=A0AAW0LZN0_QUESU